MAMNLPTPNSNSVDIEKTGLSVSAGLDNPMKDCAINADRLNAPEMLAKASKDAELAKTAVRKAIHQAFIEREESLKKAETLEQSFDEAIKSGDAQINQSSTKPVTPVKSTEYLNKVLLKRALTSGSSQSAFADIIKTYFGDKLGTETKKDNTPAPLQKNNLRQVIEHVADDQAQKKAARVIGEAKSDRIASKLAVNHAQDEIKSAREEAEIIKRTAEAAVSHACEEANATRKEAEEAVDAARKWIEQARNEVLAEKKAAGLIASQAQQEAFSQAAGEIQKAKNEVRAAKEAAGTAIRLAKEEVSKAREETEIYKKNSQMAIAALEEKVVKVVEKLKAIKQQSLISIGEAQAETQKAREEAERTQRDCQSALKQAEMESQKTNEEAKLETMKAREAIIQSEKRAYEQVREKMDQVKEEAERTRQSAYEAVVKAQEEARQAREDAEVIQKASEDAVSKAIEQKRKCQEDAEKAKQSMLELVNKAQEESRKSREESEAAIIRANDAMIKAQQDIIGMTINEMSATRQELEEAVNNQEHPGNDQSSENVQGKGQSSRVHPDVMTSVLREMRAPLHSISGFARLMLDEDVDDAATRKEFLSIVVQQSENLTQLLDNLSGKLEPENDISAAVENEETA